MMADLEKSSEPRWAFDSAERMEWQMAACLDARWDSNWAKRLEAVLGEMLEQSRALMRVAQLVEGLA